MSKKYEYKVLSREDGIWSGKFNPKKLQNKLNELAGQGWRVITTFTDHVKGSFLTTEHDEVIIILEREM